MSMSKVKIVAVILLAFMAGIGMVLMVMGSSRDSRASEPTAGKQAALVISPDKTYVAKIWLPDLGGLGATISQPHQVWIASRASESRLMLEADKTNEIKVKWLGMRLLEVCYSDAQISTFHNRFIDVNRTDGITQVKTVEVKLRRVERLDECWP